MKDQNKLKCEKRKRLKKRIHKKVRGTPDRPRMVVYRGLRNIEVQIVDDVNRVTLCALHSRTLQLDAPGSKTDISKVVGARIAVQAQEKNISKIVFDRGGYRYHGRVKALAEAARKGGLEF